MTTAIRQQRYYEDVEIGAELPSLDKPQSVKRFVRWAQASNDLADLHYDYKKMTARGLPDVVGQGALSAGYIAHMLGDFYTPDGWLKKLSVQYRGYSIPGDVLTIKGVVTKKYESDGEYLVECDVWAENQEGKKLTIGQAVVSLPSRTGEAK